MSKTTRWPLEVSWSWFPELRYVVMAHGITVPRDATASVASKHATATRAAIYVNPRLILDVRVGNGKLCTQRQTRRAGSLFDMRFQQIDDGSPAHARLAKIAVAISFATGSGSSQPRSQCQHRTGTAMVKYRCHCGPSCRRRSAPSSARRTHLRRPCRCLRSHHGRPGH